MSFPYELYMNQPVTMLFFREEDIAGKTLILMGKSIKIEGVEHLEPGKKSGFRGDHWIFGEGFKFGVNLEDDGKTYSIRVIEVEGQKNILSFKSE